jgi:copper chaperone CopZ
MKKLMTLIAFCATLSIGYAQQGQITMTSSVVCEMCKNTIEKGLAFEKGIRMAAVDVEKNTITVNYNPKKISEEEIKQAVLDMGYMAGDKKPTKGAYDSLHECCKKEGVCE